MLNHGVGTVGFFKEVQLRKPTSRSRQNSRVLFVKIRMHAMVECSCALVRCCCRQCHRCPGYTTACFCCHHLWLALSLHPSRIQQALRYHLGVKEIIDLGSFPDFP